jgi:hypothetical protein
VQEGQEVDWVQTPLQDHLELGSPVSAVTLLRIAFKRLQYCTLFCRCALRHSTVGRNTRVGGFRGSDQSFYCLCPQPREVIDDLARPELFRQKKYLVSTPQLFRLPA